MFFDLETTGFDRPIRPVQVLKVLDESEGIYNTYVIHAFSNLKQFNIICRLGQLTVGGNAASMSMYGQGDMFIQK